MLLQVSYYPLVLILNFILLLSIGIYLYRRRSVKGAFYLGCVMFATAMWSLASAFEGSAFGPEWKIIASKVSYLGIAFAAPCWLLFCLDFSEVKEVVISKVRAAILLCSLLVIVCVFTNEWHHLFWTSTIAEGSSGFAPVIYTHGVLFFIDVIYQYLALGIGTATLFIYGLQQNGAEKKHVLYTLVAVIVPWIANFYYVYVAKTVGGYDLTPLAFSATGIAIATSLFSNKYYELVDAAKEEVLDRIESGVVITNTEGVVVEMNKAAQEMLSKDIKLGVKVNGKGVFLDTTDGADVYIEKVKKWIEVSKTDLQDALHEKQGAIYYLHDITEKRAEREKELQTEYMYSSIIDFFPEPVFVIDNESKVIIWNKAMEEMTKVESKDILRKGEYVYAVPFYGEKRPMLVDLVLKGLSPAKYYKGSDVIRIGDTLSAVLEGPKKSVLTIAKPLYDKYNRKVGAIEVIRDITEQKATEKELKERLDSLVKLNDIMVKREKRITELSEKLSESNKKK